MNTPPNRDPPNFRGLPAAMAVVFGLLALLLGIGGGWLPWLGGSAYYVLLALGLLVVALLLLWRHAAALWLYVLLCLATLGWSVWEAGLDWWQLAPRLDLFAVLGLPLLLPAVWRALHWGPATRTPQDSIPRTPARDGGWVVAAALLAGERAGSSRPCTTTCGITTCPRNPAWSTCRSAAPWCLRSYSQRSRENSSCWTGAPASRCFR